MTDNENALPITGKIQYVPLGEMRLSPMAQRHLRPLRVTKLEAHMDLEMLGLPEVNLRDLLYFIIDGQHRIEALKNWLGKGWETQEIECRVYIGLTEKQEAAKFDDLANVLAVHSFDRFRVRCNAGRQPQIDISKIVVMLGLKISQDAVPGAISAVSALTRVFDRSSGEVLGCSLRIIREAYGDVGFRAPIIDGIGHFCQRYDGLIDEAVVIERLKKAHGGVAGLMNKADVLHRATGNIRGHCVAAAAVEIVNSKRGSKKLPSWW